MSGAVPEHSPVTMSSVDSLLAGSVEESHLLRKLFNLGLHVDDFFVRPASEPADLSEPLLLVDIIFEFLNCTHE